MRILLVVNDSQAALQLEQQCRAILGPRLTHLAAADSIRTACGLMESAAFDVVLLDPDLMANEGFELPAPRTNRAFRPIVISANPELSIRAFEHGVLDFVPKPVTRDRLALALDRAGRQAGPGDVPELYLAVRRMGRIDLVPLSDLLYVEGADKYSELVLTNGQRSFYDKCLGHLETTLPPTFVRIHKSYLVRFPMISRLVVRRGSRYFAELRNGLRLPVGRSRYERIKSRLI